MHANHTCAQQISALQPPALDSPVYSTATTPATSIKRCRTSKRQFQPAQHATIVRGEAESGSGTSAVLSSHQKPPNDPPSINNNKASNNRNPSSALAAPSLVWKGCGVVYNSSTAARRGGEGASHTYSTGRSVGVFNLATLSSSPNLPLHGQRVEATTRAQKAQARPGRAGDGSRYARPCWDCTSRTLRLTVVPASSTLPSRSYRPPTSALTSPSPVWKVGGHRTVAPLLLGERRACITSLPTGRSVFSKNPCRPPEV